MRLILIFLTCCFINTAFADELIVEPEMGRAPILNFINQTQHALNLVMYDFTDKTLLNALLAEQRAGKQVRVILEKAPYKNESLNINTMNVMNTQKLAWHPGAHYFQYTHQKSLVSDDQRALIMTFNFTLSSFKNQRNFALLIDNPKLSHDINTNFNADWQQQASPPTNNPALLFSPNTSRQGYLQAIAASQLSMQIYEQSIADAGMVDALCDAANRGVNIQIITSKMPPKKFSAPLLNAGVTIKISKKLYIHAKAMVIDHRTVILGSVNFTPTSLDQNRELAILSKDPSVVRELSNTFYNDWNGLESTSKPSHASNQVRNPAHTPLEKAAYHFVQAIMVPALSRQAYHHLHTTPTSKRARISS